MMSKVMVERVRAIMDQARQDAATELLAWDKVELAIRTAAGRGDARVVMTPAKTINIKGTEAAVLIVHKLDGLGFRTSWESRRDTDGAEYFALAIAW